MQAVTSKTLQSVLQSSTRSLRTKAALKHPHVAAITVAQPPGCSRCFHQSRPSSQLQNPKPPSDNQQSPSPPSQQQPQEQQEQQQEYQETESHVPSAKRSDNSRGLQGSQDQYISSSGIRNGVVSPRQWENGPTLGNGGDPDGVEGGTSSGVRFAGPETITSWIPPEPTIDEPTLPGWFYDGSVFLPSELKLMPEKIKLYTDNVENKQASEGVEGDVAVASASEAVAIDLSPARTLPLGEETQPESTGKSDAEASRKSDEAMKEYASTLDVFESLSAPKQWLTTTISSLDQMYMLHQTVWEEIVAQVRGSLMLPKSNFIDGITASKSHCVLLFPQPGGTYFLDSIVEKVAAEVNANLVRIDPQDLEEFASEYFGEVVNPDHSVPQISIPAVSSLGYEAQLQNEYAREPEEVEEEGVEEEGEVEEPEEPEAQLSRTPPVRGLSPKAQNPPDMFRKFLMNGFKGASAKMYAITPASNGRMVPIDPSGLNKLLAPGGPSGLGFADGANEVLQEKRMSAFLSVLLRAGDKKSDYLTATLQPKKRTATSSSKPAVKESSKTIIHIRDYIELESTGQNAGEGLLKAIHSIVDQQRRAGKQVVIIGTSSSEQELEHLTRSGIRALQAGGEYDQERAIIVPPHLDLNRIKFSDDQMRRVREVNVRHLRDVIRQRSSDANQPMDLIVPKDWHMHLDHSPTVPDINSWVWSYNTVHRVALTAIGMATSADTSNGGQKTISLSQVEAAASLLANSDRVKASWASEESVYQNQLWREEEVSEKSRLDKISQTCSVHEKKLLTGVINPADINTGFSSVQVANDTVDALKTLTSLSLTRPEAFSYGVLSRNRIPGVLLYGPPGTGKTLLAKAVAKESGATVLEVSGSEVFDMYVGEGEKNVKAIFSLAKKLSPCVVFIDEADAIFGSRQSHSTRATHRELINQFLKEWDGMLTTSAFIMVATNRPFDLDDAVIRRLPRRLLVDLPEKKDRLEILKIHLQNEELASDVDLIDIASDARTNLYSGSDLKNVCVAAALSCVKEENESYKTTGTYPKQRTLSKRHFDKALEDISASISDDMSSLQLIRKFDEKYGDKHGKRKRKPKWGFGNTLEDPKDMGTGRVRN